MQKIPIKTAEEIIQKYANNFAKILTPNQRLVSYLRQLLEQYNQSELKNCFWEEPVIIPFASYLSLLWDNIPNATTLLNAAQEYALWEKIIINNPLKHTTPTTSKQNGQIIHDAIKAWYLLHNWQISLEQLSQCAFTEETQCFCYWAKKCQEYLHAQNCCTLAEIPQQLVNILLNNKKCPEPLLLLLNNLLLVGFDNFTLTPQEKRLINVISHPPYNRDITYLDPNQFTSQQRLLVAASVNDETHAMAQWAYELHMHKPSATIGCIVPELGRWRDNILRIFSQVFTNNTNKHSYNTYNTDLPPSINISLGESLNQYPIISCALTILSLGRNNLPMEDWHLIFASPFIKDNWLDYVATTKAWDKIKSSGILFKNNPCSFNQLSSILKEFCTELFIAIQRYKKALASKAKLQPVKDWIAFFNTQLQIFGWPGSRKLNNCESQTIARWKKLCHTFGTLDLIYPNGLTYEEALTKLFALTQNTIFQPRLPDNNQAHIHILGTLEATAINFDYLWVISMDDQSWPTPPTPNPFIPLELQRKLDMPNTSITRELEYCCTIVNRWQRSTQNITYSYTHQDNDRINRASPIIRHIPETTITTLASNNTNQAATAIFHLLSTKLERHTDSVAPPVDVNEKISGGTSILQTQISCPFQAFALFRLNARTAVKTSQKLWRGNIIHKALEQIWQTLKDSEKLDVYYQNPTQLEKLITIALDDSIAILQQESPQNFSSNYLALEKLNLHNLLLHWLEIERERNSFTVIKTEEETAINIGGLTLRLRIDRIDRLADGKIAIIDYKTGKEVPSISECLSVPPTITQLPLYSLTVNNYPEQNQTPLAAIIFAHVNRENSILNHKPFHGLVDQENTFSQKSHLGKWTHINLESMMAEWKKNLTKVARDFMHGVASVSPHNTQVCRSCDLQSLCRRCRVKSLP